MDEKEGHGGGFRRDKDDDHPDHRKDRNMDELGFKNQDGRSDEVAQAESIDDIIRDLLRMFGNNDRVEENSNVDVRESQIDRSGSVYEFGQSSANRDALNQRNMPRSQNTGNIGNSSNGTSLGNGVVVGHGTSGTRLVLPSGILSHGSTSNQRNVIGQATNGTQTVYHSESSNHDLNINWNTTHGAGPGLHSESLNHGPMLNERNVLGQGGEVIGTTVAVLRSRSVIQTPPRQMGRFTVSQEISTSVDMVFFIPRGVHEHNTLVELGMYRHTHYEVGRFRVSITEPPILNSGFFIPRTVLDNNMQIRSDQNMVNGNMFRQGTPMVQTDSYIGFYGAPTHPFFPTFPSQGVGLPVVGPSVNMPPISDHEYNVEMLPNANMAIEPGDEHNGTMGEASHREEGVSQHDRRESDTGHENGQGST